MSEIVKNQDEILSTFKFIEKEESDIQTGNGELDRGGCDGATEGN